MTNKQERTARYQEWLGLKQLPYLSEEQNQRFTCLSKQRVLDNKQAFKEDKIAEELESETTYYIETHGQIEGDRMHNYLSSCTPAEKLGLLKETK